jgi:hypothetical protein
VYTSPKGIGVGAAPKARTISTKTGLSGTRTLRPTMSSGLVTSRSAKVKLRQPQYQMRVSGTIECLLFSSAKIGSKAGPRITVSASFQSFHRKGALAISIPGTSEEVTGMEGADMSSAPDFTCCSRSASLPSCSEGKTRIVTSPFVRSPTRLASSAKRSWAISPGELA